MAVGDEKCSACKQSPFPRGFDPESGKCWYCAFPGVGVTLSEAQRAKVEESWANEALA